MKHTHMKGNTYQGHKKENINNYEEESNTEELAYREMIEKK